MSYLRTVRGQTILLCFLGVALLTMVFPQLDLLVSSWFYDNGFHLADHFAARFLHESVAAFILISVAWVMGVFTYNQFSGRQVAAIDARKVAYYLLVLIVGVGLTVNVALKDHFGRVRPRNVVEFGGSGQFTPAFVVTDGCGRNCSFSSGDSAGAFLALAFSMAFARRRCIAMTAIAYGLLVSISRIASGAHFLSDTLTSFFIMLVVSDVLQHYMLPGVAGSLDRRALPRLAPATAGSGPIHFSPDRFISAATRVQDRG